MERDNEGQEKENTVELRVGSRVLLLKSTENVEALENAKNSLEPDILIYSVKAEGTCFHTVTYNGGDMLDYGQHLEIGSNILELIQKTSEESNGNVKVCEQFCVATKLIEPGDELVLYNEVVFDSETSSEHTPTPVKEEMNLVDLTVKKIKSKLNFQDTISPPELPSEQGFQCNRCGKMFSYAYYRDKHLKYTRCVDNGDRKFPCTLCNRSFEKRDRLRIHILHVHENHRPHVCNVCGKAFSQSSSLNKHLRVHSGERPYQCPYCTKSFTASSILRTHIRQHSGEKPFKCAFCGKSFASHAAHDSHVRRTHTTLASTFRCVHCDKCFETEEHLNFHMECVHGNQLCN